MSKTVFDECDDTVYALKVELLNDYHSSLRNAEIKCLFYDRAKKRGGKIILGTAEAVSSKFKYLTGIDFIISIYKGVWDIMASQERRALLDHEMSHCSIGEDKDGNPTYKIIPHDIEDFAAILDRYGVDWADNVYISADGIEEE
jgi:hypothetical protein